MKSVWWLAAVCTSVSTLSQAETVTLRSGSTNLSFTGEIVSLDGDIVRLQTALMGTISLPADDVDCFGESCPPALVATVAPGAATALPAPPSLGRDRLDAPVVAGDGGAQQILGYEALVPVAGPEVPIRRITLDLLADLFSGRVTDWSEIAGPALPVRLIVPSALAGTNGPVAEMLLTQRGLSLTSGLTLPSDDMAALSVLDETAGAIALVSSDAVPSSSAMPIAETCDLVATPQPFEIRSQRYPLARILVTGGPAPLAGEKETVVAAASGAPPVAMAEPAVYLSGDVSVAARGHVQDWLSTSYKLIALSDPDEGLIEDLDALSAAIAEAKRISPTFRPDRSGLDPLAEARIEQIVAHLGAGKGTGSGDGTARGRILIAGFTSPGADGKAAAIARSQRQADAVRRAIAEQAPDFARSWRIEARGFGGIAPISCAEGTAGQVLNERVEIWIGDQG